MLLSVYLYYRYNQPDFFFCLFHFIFELLSIFMGMITISKIELINATETCILNMFSIYNFLLPTELFLIQSIPIWSVSKGLDTKCTKALYSILTSKKIYNFVE